jgi:hypothetical protein
MKLHAGWFYAASPRSTVEWYSIGESVGIYAQGLTPEGNPADYHEHIESKGLGIFGGEYDISEHTKFQAWDYYFEHVSNTVFLQLDHKIPLDPNNTSRLVLGTQFLHQNTVGEGGNHEAKKAYMPLGQSNRLYVFRAGFEKEKWQLTLNYLQADENGRFTFPREWGREQFYTTVSRGRIEGLGGVRTLMSTLHYSPTEELEFTVDLGRVMTPNIDDYELNRLENVSYDQFNFDVRYHFPGKLEGMHMRFLYVHKRSIKDYGENIEPLFYTADFHHFNLITNIYF